MRDITKNPGDEISRPKIITHFCFQLSGLAYSTDYTWVVVCEILEVFTLSLVWVTAVLYFRHLVPRKYTATGQALPVIAHFCIGKWDFFVSAFQGNSNVSVD